MIVFKDVSKTYPNGFTALKHVNLTINDGDFICIIGLSGAGKSTMIRTINKMHSITEGVLLVNGMDISKAKGKELRAIRKNIGMIFQSFNLVKRSSADQLSGGQMQRVALARALTQEPSIILADEPVASLDPITTLSVMDDFKRINEEEKITIVANMHHVDLALKYATRVIGIRAGEIVFDGLPEEVNDEVLISIYGRALNQNEKLGVEKDEE